MKFKKIFFTLMLVLFLVSFCVDKKETLLSSAKNKTPVKIPGSQTDDLLLELYMCLNPDCTLKEPANKFNLNSDASFQIKALSPFTNDEIDIYYSLENKEPLSKGELYKDYIYISTSKVLSVQAKHKTLSLNSELQSYTFIIDTSSPVISNADYTQGGTFNEFVQVSLSASDENDFKIYYTTDGSLPGEDSSIYSESFIINTVGITTLRFIAIDFVGNKSNIITVSYSILDPGPPLVSASILGGTYISSQNIFLSIDAPYSGLSDAYLCYTLSTTATNPVDPVYPADCIEATNDKTKGVEKITSIDSDGDSRIIKYFAISPGGQQSSISMQNYLLNSTAPQITISDYTVNAVTKDKVGIDSPFNELLISWDVACSNVPCDYILKKDGVALNTANGSLNVSGTYTGIAITTTINANDLNGGGNNTASTIAIEVTDNTLVETGIKQKIFYKDDERPVVSFTPEDNTQVDGQSLNVSMMVAAETSTTICFTQANGKTQNAVSPVIDTSNNCTASVEYSSAIAIDYIAANKSNYQFKAIARDSAGNLSSAVTTANYRLVPDNMIRISNTGTAAADVWIDQYEASVSAGIVGLADGTTTTAKAKSQYNVYPSAYLSYYQAKKACQNANKRLCSSIEWETTCSYSGTYTYPYGNSFNSTSCNSYSDYTLSLSYEKNGQNSSCKTADWLENSSSASLAAFDLSGNLYEWTNEQIGIDEIYRLKGGSYLSGYQQSSENVLNLQCGSGSDGVAEAGMREKTIGFRCCFDED